MEGKENMRSNCVLTLQIENKHFIDESSNEKPQNTLHHTNPSPDQTGREHKIEMNCIWPQQNGAQSMAQCWGEGENIHSIKSLNFIIA